MRPDLGLEPPGDLGQCSGSHGILQVKNCVSGVSVSRVAEIHNSTEGKKGSIRKQQQIPR